MARTRIAAKAPPPAPEEPATQPSRARPSRGEIEHRLAQLGKVAKGFQRWRPSREILTRVRAHRTIFPQLDRATRVGGWPLERVALVHGPSNHGKTSLLHGVGLSFLKAANYYALVDAERTTSEGWLEELMADEASNPGFVAMRPDRYEDAVKGVRELVEGVLEAKAKGALADDVTGFVVVDSVRKLVPTGLLDKLMKGEGGIDGASGRAAMMKAALNSQWLDELVPLMHHARFSIALVTRESQAVNAKPWDPQYKIQGGEGLKYESSLTLRVTRASWVTDAVPKKKGEEEDDKPRRVFGERHAVRITKTKVGGKDGKDSVAYFHTSNGALVPSGFDRARDVLDLALRLGVVERGGAWLSYGKVKLGQGDNRAVVRLQADPDLLGEIASKLELGEGEQLSETEEVESADGG